MSLSNVRAVITGASQGLGKQIAKEFLEAGASVAICARDGELLDEAKRELEVGLQPGQTVFGKTCDVSSENEVAALIDYVERELGGIDVLVTNAGISGPKGPTEGVDWREWVRTIEVNLYGVALPCRAVIPKFKAAGQGKVIVLSGGGATAPMPFNSAYAALKSRGCPPDGNISGRTARFQHPGERCRTWRFKYTIPNSSFGIGTRKSRCRGICQGAETEGDGWRIHTESCIPLCLFGVSSERRTYGEADQCSMGPLGDASAAYRRFKGGHLHA